MVDTCHVVDQFCDSPANLSPARLVRGSCYVCANPVCTKCSSRRKYLHYGRVRICNDCQVELDGNNERVMARLNKQAGY